MEKENEWQTTSKKQRLVGQKILVDPETGEAIPFAINQLEDRDFNFTKVWLQNLIHSLDEISNQKLRLAFWIVDNLDTNNKLTMTQRQMAEKSGMSVKTVSRTVQALCEGGFLQRINGGAYRVNPNVLYKGSHKNRMGIMFEYRETALENGLQPPDEEDYEAPLDGQMTTDELESA